MSGSLSFITTNRSMPAYDAETQRQRVDTQERQTSDVDRALRGGLANVVARSPEAAPAAAPAPAPARAPAVRSASVASPEDDDDAAVRTIIGEAANQGEQGMAGVAHVIRNRSRQSGMSARDVVLAPSQFEPWQTRRQQLMAIDPNGPQYQEALRVWRGTSDGTIADPTGGADHFLEPNIVRQRTGGTLPAWAQGEGTQVGAHTFYRVGYRGNPGGGGGGAPSLASVTPVSATAPPAQRTVGGQLAPAVQEMLRVPGGGQAALRLLQAGQTMQTAQDNTQVRRDAITARATQQAARNPERTAAERNMMIALGRGDVDVARVMAQRAGIELPEQVWQDRGNHARFAAGTMLAQRYYGTSRDQAAQFVREYVRDGNALRAAESVGAPRGRTDGWRPVWVQEGEQQVLQLLNPTTGTVRPAQREGGSDAPITRTPGTGRPTASQDRRATLMRIYDNDQAVVDRILSGVEPNARQIAQAYQRAIATAANDPRIMSNSSAQIRRAEQQMDGLFPTWRAIRDRQNPPTRPAAPAPAPSPAPAPAATAPPRPAAVPPGSMFSPRRQMWRDPDGNIYGPDGARIAPGA